MTQVETALISAATAAAVTLLIEYAAKPRLEARKDRILEQTREYRKLMTRLLAMSNELGFLGAMGRSGPTVSWEAGRTALDQAYKDFGGLSANFDQFHSLISKRQRRLLRAFSKSILTQLILVVHLLEIGADEFNAKQAEVIEKQTRRRIQLLIEAFAVLYAMLVQRRWKIFVYRRRIREFEEYQNNMDERIDQLAKGRGGEA